MKMTFEARGAVGVLRVEEPRIDASVAIQFKDRFRDLAGSAEGDVILDLARVEFLDSSGLGAVVAARKLLGSGRQLALSGLTPTVDKVMTLTRMNTVFPIHADLAAALAAHAGSG
ncbi:STAS domain-containing protein [Roseicyclus persicicus]|uniref:Anti-sigma factor antagonist n=1 Tax=Roseicyclus persicicus TaxID=2650661 RepID=A0A7X6JY89_9RHOB|nr:STAS domain-containing protein [Roseibacterium persicicum]NKX45555.1 STAS domain-containing protein [Roseibacterium persicicum]